MQGGSEKVPSFHNQVRGHFKSNKNKMSQEDSQLQGAMAPQGMTVPWSQKASKRLYLSIYMAIPRPPTPNWWSQQEGQKVRWKKQKSK